MVAGNRKRKTGGAGEFYLSYIYSTRRVCFGDAGALGVLPAGCAFGIDQRVERERSVCAGCMRCWCMCVAVKYAPAVKACALKTQPLLNSSETCHYQGNPRPVRHWCGGHSQTQHTKKQQPAHHTLTSVQLLLSSARAPLRFRAFIFVGFALCSYNVPALLFYIYDVVLYRGEDVLQAAVQCEFPMYFFCAMQNYRCARVCYVEDPIY